ncbi:hypothetical protein ACN2CC_28110 [Mesorhizobium muleiense]|uniref:hypothetical protein n=1 Tax=Mesorhizobium muleiense TaxID=1004279 RepID=UPI003AFB6AAC
MTSGRLALRSDWYRRDIDSGFDLDLPGIYEWRIEGVGIYVGKALRLKRRLAHYPNNVRRMLQDLPWHGNPNRDYRGIHHALRRAYEHQIVTSVAVLETCSREARSEREQYWIRQRRAEQATGGPKVLNAELGRTGSE